MSLPLLALLGIGCACFCVIIVRTCQLVGRWKRGKAAQVPHWIKALSSVPKRYLRDVHAIVAREPRNARMHATLVIGLIGSLFASIYVASQPSLHGAVILAVMFSIGVFGLVLQFLRRHQAAPGRYSKGSWSYLTIAFGAVFVFLLIVGLRSYFDQTLLTVLFYVSCLGALCAGLWLVYGVKNGPMRHAVAGVAHLAFHPRPARFQAPQPVGHADTALLPRDVDGNDFGVGTIEDFSWNRLASFDACVQCGRCEVLCPAFASGAPLSPRNLIKSLSAAIDLATVGSNGGNGSHQLVSEMNTEGAGITPDTLWSCTTCRACVEACPMMIEHVDALVDLRRFQVMEEGNVPERAAEVLENLRMTDTQGGFATSTRLDGLVDLNLPLATQEKTDVLLWLGESAFERRNQRQIRAFIKILRKANVQFAVQSDELDTGDLARRLGDEVEFQRLAKENISRLSKLNFNRIVTMDPHVMHVIRREYQAFGPQLKVQHYSEVLLELVNQGRLDIQAVNKSITYHDPCYLGRYNGEYEAPRELLTRLGLNLIEMERSQSRSRCCGGGGGAPLVDVESEQRIPDQRMEDVMATGSGCVVVACPFCTQMLEGVGGERAEVLDLAEMVLEAVEGNQ